MTEHDAFERRLADALRGYAAEARTEVESLQLAHAVARDHPRRSGWSAVVGLPRRRSPLWWALLGALLILGSTLALAAVGAWLMKDVPELDPGHPIPQALHGEFEGNGPGPDAFGNYGMYVVDLTATAIVRLESSNSGEGAHSATGVWGSAAEWVGRAIAFTPTGPGVGELIIRSPGSCGDGRYVLRANVGEGQSDAPSARPASAPSGNSTLRAPEVLRWDQVYFTRLEDACSERVAILTGGPWQHRATELVVGERYDSWFFTEPFQFAAPGAAAGAMPWISPSSLRIGNVYWGIWFIDDEPVQLDVCDPSKGRLADVPATPEAVGEWLRSASRLTISEPIELTVDGRTALRFDTQPSVACDGGSQLCQVCDSGPLEGSFQVGFRVYAIPTGDDTIIAVVGSDGPIGQADVLADEIVRSMTFD